VPLDSKGPGFALPLPLSLVVFPRFQVGLCLLFALPIALYRPLSAGGPGAVPSEDYSRWPPLLAVSRRAKGDGQDKQRSTKKTTKMKTNTTTQTEEGARVQSKQIFKAPEGEFNKYIVLLWQGHEQVTVFPFAMKHAEVFRHMQRECPDLKAISAGFYIVEGGEVWCTGRSESLNLTSRPEDRQAIEALLETPDRQLWDLVRLSEEARQAARQEMAEAGWC
jgi:hypothetical protein